MAKDTVKLNGIIDTTFGGFTCIRGYAESNVLTSISKADDKSYQRDLDPVRVKEIEKYLSSGNYMFFPEIILSIPLYFDYTKYNETLTKANKPLEPYEPMKEIYSNKGFESNVINLKVKGKKGGNATIIINHDYLRRGLFKLATDEKYIFARIDGNHRLSAMSKNKDPMIGKKVPFCIILLPQDGKEKKTEYVLFNNINSKAKPLTNYENIKGIISGDLFSESELENEEDFDKRYLYCKRFINEFEAKQMYEMQSFIEKKEELVEFIFDLLTLAEEHKIPYKAKEFPKRIFKKLIELDCNDIKKNIKAVIAISLLNFDAIDFIRWIKKSDIYNKLNDSELVELYIAKMTSAKKDIFYSLSISEPGADDRYNAVKRAVDKVNNDYNQQLNLIRVDARKEGESFEITDKIIACIKACGLLVADLTGNNANVAHEIGFLMGYNEFKKTKRSENILITLQKPLPPGSITKSIPSNIRQHRALVYSDNTKLEQDILEELIAKYELKTLYLEE